MYQMVIAMANVKLMISALSALALVSAGVQAGNGEPAAAESGIEKAAPGILKAKDPIKNQYLVLFKGGAVTPTGSATSGTTPTLSAAATQALAAALAAQYNGVVDAVWSAAVNGMSVNMVPAKAAALAKDSRVASVEEDGLVKLDVTQTGATWGLDRIDQRNLPLSASYTYTTNGTGVTVYVIDTGIRKTHSELSGRVSVGFTAVSDGNGTEDCNGHGTHVSGTIGGLTYGVAKNVTLVPVRVLDCWGSGSWSGVISGIDWVSANKKLPAVANMSLGGGYSASVNTAVANSITAGITYAVASGNSNDNACNYSPASTPTAITVGATDSADNRASFSSYGTCLDVFAPGRYITSSWNSSDTATNTISGTSMATPHVAGAAALYLSNNRTATPAQVATALTASATLNKVVNVGTGSPNRLLFVGSTDVVPPTASLASPVAGQILTGTVSLAANAADNIAVGKVEFYAGTTLLGTATAAPFQVSWNSATLANGTYSFTAKATDTSGNTATSAAVSAVVQNTASACNSTSQLVLNPGFESGSASWAETRGVISYVGTGASHAGNYAGWLDGYGVNHADTLYQQVTIPSNACAADFRFWLKIATSESTTSVAYDKLTVTVRNTAGTVLGTLATYSNLNKSATYVQKSFNLLPYKGQTVRLYFLGVENFSLHTSFFVDDAALTVKK